MKKLLTERTAIYSLLLILSLIVVFHFLVLLGVIPFQVVWGGRLTERAQMMRFEMVSIIVNLLMLAIVALRAGWWKVLISPVIIRVALWLMCGLFLLNTLGNLFSINKFEKLVFTPLTLILSLCCLRLALGKPMESAAS
jgi:hypothetical protein